MSDNELIAKFMGLTRIEAGGNYNKVQYYKPATDKRKRGDFVGYFDDLDYHKSWDHLMPVVEKIERLKVKCEVRGLTCEMWLYYEDNEIISGSSNVTKYRSDIRPLAETSF